MSNNEFNTKLENDARLSQEVANVTDFLQDGQPLPSAQEITTLIGIFFTRNQLLYDDDIKVAVNGTEVTLSGTVADWKERELAEEIVTKVPGVTKVINRIYSL
jgi:osmotically-inducible protein OsmY